MPAQPIIVRLRPVDLGIEVADMGCRRLQGRGAAAFTTRATRCGSGRIHLPPHWPYIYVPSARHDASPPIHACRSHPRPCGRRFRCCWRSLLAGCGEAPKAPAAPPPPAVTVAPPVKRTIVDQDEYVGRFVAGRGGRSARARLRLSREGAFPGRPDRQGRRSAVHHRQAAVPEHARPGARQSGRSRNRTSAYTAGRSGARAATGARPDHHRADLRAARPGQPQRASVGRGERGRWCARPSSIWSSPSCARRSPAASATGA